VPETPTAVPRWRAVAGIVGPASFVTAWSVLGTIKPNYSPVHDPISRLAAIGSSTRVPMTLGFLGFGAGVAAYGKALRTALPGGAGVTAALTAAATVGVALIPLGGPLGTPLLGGITLVRRGHRGAAIASFAASLTTAAALVGTVVSPDHTGLLQRTGLTAGDVWLVTTALWMLRRRGPGASAGVDDAQSATSVGTLPS
jgi:hypothetical protein